MTLQITINQTLKPKKRLHTHDQLPAHLPGLTNRAGYLKKEYRMTENEFLLADRIQKIKSTIEQYGEDNFF